MRFLHNFPCFNICYETFDLPASFPNKPVLRLLVYSFHRLSRISLSKNSPLTSQFFTSKTQIRFTILSVFNLIIHNFAIHTNTPFSSLICRDISSSALTMIFSMFSLWTLRTLRTQTMNYSNNKRKNLQNL